MGILVLVISFILLFIAGFAIALLWWFAVPIAALTVYKVAKQ